VRLPVVVHRKNGSAGNIACTYYTEQDSAVKDVDYEHAEGRLEFTPGQVSAELTLNILPRGRYEKKEIFRLYLADPQGGARFDETTDGGSKNCILTVTIAPEEGRKTIVDNLLSVVNQDQLRQGNRTYKQQLLSAIFPDAGDDEDGEPQSRSERAMQLVMHVLLLPWNIFFALIPPPEYCGGWLCFSLSLVAIGFVTAMIGDLAALFGCVMSLPDGITAITFVALGTSLPDTFASKTAAEQDPSADASVGNVTGSNSVNVFLGLGLPWTIGAVYWRLAGRNADWQEEYRDHGDFALWNQGGGKFVVVGGDLGFSVAVFTGCAVCCLLILAIRRSLFGGELGGPKRYAYLSSCIMVLLWVLYIALSSWKIMQSYKC
jgi:Ca2+/Na+ antiporter